MADESWGKVVQVIGPVIDVEFEEEGLPEIYNALELDEHVGDMHIKLTAEVAQHLGRNQVRAISMASTDGVVRGNKVKNTGAPISVPVGMNTLGRVFNLLGETVDHGPPLDVQERRPIHREPPEFKDLSVKTEIFETGIKVVDLLAPYAKGGKTGLFGGGGIGRSIDRHRV